jgi:hypothetical protein
MKRIEKAVKTRILAIPENVNSNAFFHRLMLRFKRGKGKISRFNDLKKFEGDNFDYSP